MKNIIDNKLSEIRIIIEPFSFSEIAILRKTNKLKPLFEKTNNVLKLIKIDTKNFLDILFDNKYNYYEKKILLHDKEITNISSLNKFLLCSYFNNLSANNNFILFLLTIIDKLNIKEYKDITMDILYKKISMYMDITIEENKYLINKKSKGYYTNYDKYDYSNLDKHNPLELFLISEYNTYIEEKELSNKVIWVSRYYGDGYGFDILSKEDNKEKLIEVKSGKTYSFGLTEKEYKTMIECTKYNASYYIYKYTYINDFIILEYLKYDNINNRIISINNNSIYGITKGYNNKGDIIYWVESIEKDMRFDLH